MRIWTTTQIKESLLGNGLDAVVQSERFIKTALLDGAGTQDAAVLPFEPDYQAFLADIRRRGMRGPVIFISSGSASTVVGSASQNALILNAERLGLAQARSIIRFILAIFMERGPSDAVEFEPSLLCTMPGNEPQKQTPVGEVLLRLKAENIPVVLSFQVMEDLRNTVTAQANCLLKTFTPEAAVFWKLSSMAIISRLKKGTDIDIRFSVDGNTYQTAVKIIAVGDNEFSTSMPSSLSPMTRRFSRVKPSPRRPVLVYVLMPKLPTTLLNVKEISQRGIGFIAPDGLAIGAITAFSVILPEPVQETVLTAGIIRSKIETPDGFRYGAEFLLHPRDEEKMARYVMQREQEIMGLLRER